MPTKYMKLGSSHRVLREDGFYNVTLCGNQVAFNVDVRLNYYRGLPFSCLEKLELYVDGERIPDHLIMFSLNDKWLNYHKPGEALQEYWGIRTSAHLLVFNYGLPEGEHEVELVMEFRSPYMIFPDGDHGHIDSGCKKVMKIGERREM